MNVKIVGTHDQAVHACVSWPGQSPWLFSAIYAKPCGVKRTKLWEYLNFDASYHDIPWLLARDFNDLLHFDDKLGGAPLCCLRGFKAWFEMRMKCVNCILMALSTLGPIRGFWKGMIGEFVVHFGDVCLLKLM